MRNNGRWSAALLWLGLLSGAAGVAAQTTSSPSLRLDRPGGGFELICLASPLVLEVLAGETTLSAAALQNNLGCPAGFDAPAGAHFQPPPAAGGEQPPARTAAFPNGGQFPPRLILDLPGGGAAERCLAEIPAVLSAADQPTFVVLQALQADGGCPVAGGTVTINSFTLAPDPLDIAANNCTVGGLPRTCLTAAWNVTVPAGVTSPGCTVTQIGGGLSMQPAGFTNPSAFTNPGNPGQFIAAMPALQWPLNTTGVTTGLKTFRMTCDPGGQSVQRTVQFNQSDVAITAFNIVQSVAPQGGTIDFNWQVTVSGAPAAPSCALRSLTAGVIDPVPVNLSPAPGNQSGSGSAAILPGAPTGDRVFRFECTPGMSTSDDTVNITPPPVVTISSFDIVPASAEQGQMVQFNWSVEVLNAPPSPSCTLTSVNDGVIDPVPVILDSTPNGQSGSEQMILLTNAPLGTQNFLFTCQPGGNQAGDSLTVQSPSNPQTIPVDFTPELTAFRGQPLAFGWAVFLQDNPASPSCTVSSTTGGVVNPLTLPLPTAPVSQSGSNSIDIQAGAPLGNRVLRFQCLPGSQFIDVAVTVQDPPQPQILIDAFDVIETQVPQGGVLNFTYTVTLVNDPANPSCTLVSTGNFPNQTIPLPAAPATQSGSGNVTLNPPPSTTGTITVRLTCGPNFAQMTDTVEVVLASTPNVGIMTFDIVEDSIDEGTGFTVNWAVVVSGSPASPSCVLTGNMAGVIDPVTVPLTSKPADQNGSFFVNLLPGAPSGVQSFDFSCTPGSSQRTEFVSIVAAGANPRIQINSFNIVQTAAVQGGTINFDWNVTLLDMPSNPVCSLNASGVINSVTVPLAPSPATQSGSGTAQILAGAPTGSHIFTFNCAPGGASLSDSVLITTPATPEIFIDDFQIVQATAGAGEFIDFTFAVTLSNNPANPQCTLSSVGTIDPVTIVLAGNPTQSDAGSVQIRADATQGDKNFVFSCTPGSDSVTRTLTITPPGTPSVGIVGFNIVETNAAQGATINFDWSVVLTDNPQNASCTLSSNTPGVISDVVVALDPQFGSNQSGSGIATVLGTAPTGSQGFSFTCTPGGALRTDSVDITASGGNPEVLINSFAVIESSAPQGGQLNFDWSVTLVDNPSPASCVLSADNAGVLANNVTIGLGATPSVQSGSGTVNLAPGAPAGIHTLRFTCNPGGNFAVDTVDVTSVAAPAVEVNSFNIAETGAGQGGTINYTFSVTLLNNPSNVSCTLTSTTEGVIDPVTILLPSTPASQSDVGSVQILAGAPTGIRTFRFECNPGGQFRTDTVNITAPGTLAILDFNVRNVTAPRGSDVIFDFTVQRQNNPVNPSCTLSSPGVIMPVTVPVPTGGTTVQSISDQLANILLEAPLGDADFTLTCTPGGQTAVDIVTIEPVPPPGIQIIDFEILQTTAAPGAVIDFTFSVRRIGLPPAPECVLLAFSTIDDLTVPISTAGNATVDDSDMVQIRPDAPASGQAGTQFTFACRISPSEPFADSQGDVVFVQ